MNTSWQRRRGAFNHDWLKNQVLPAVDAAENVLKGTVRSEISIGEVLAAFLDEWPERRADITGLLNDFDAQMSPVSHASEELSGSADAREVMLEVADALWKARYPVLDWIRNARAACDAVDAAYFGVQPALRLGQPLTLADVYTIGAACRALAGAVEQLPSRVLVT